MLRFAVFTLISLFTLTESSSQKEGDQWVIGYYGLGSPQFSVMNLDFRTGNLEIKLRYDLTMKIIGTASNICNAIGEPIIWTNGMEVFGYNGNLIADTIAYNEGEDYWQHFYSDFYEKPGGFPQIDGATILTFPESDNTYSVIYHSAEDPPGANFKISRFLEARIRLEADSAYTLLHQDSLIGDYHQWYSKRIKVVRHGNGRDWWIVAFEENSGRYYSYVLNPEGIKRANIGETGTPVPSSSGGSACFSPNGNYFARLDAISSENRQYITLYSFNRCNGDFEILETFESEFGVYSGTAFSPSGQYLFGNNNTHLWQWDLWAEDIAASQTLVDTFDGFVEPPGGFGTFFGPQALAPDGRIYIIPPAGSSRFMHVIDRPDLPAEECNFRQHIIELAAPNGRSIPNIPNFRLGSLDGSPCDTLGIDNIPVARWRHEEDEPDVVDKIRFTDLSFYNPTEWYWEFGDGQTSDESSPVHTYEESGIYNVCLTVSNENGSSIKCQELKILTTALHEELKSTPDLTINPNPFVDQLQIKSRKETIRIANLQVFDMHGMLVLHQPSIPIPSTLRLSHLASGIYYIRIKDSDGKFYNFKAMKV